MQLLCWCWDQRQHTDGGRSDEKGMLGKGLGGRGLRMVAQRLRLLPENMPERLWGWKRRSDGWYMEHRPGFLRRRRYDEGDHWGNIDSIFSHVICCPSRAR